MHSSLEGRVIWDQDGVLWAIPLEIFRESSVCELIMPLFQAAQLPTIERLSDGLALLRTIISLTWKRTAQLLSQGHQQVTGSTYAARVSGSGGSLMHGRK